MIRILFQRAYNVLILPFSVFLIPTSIHAVTPYQIVEKAAGKYVSFHTFQAEYRELLYVPKRGLDITVMNLKSEPRRGKYYEKFNDLTREKIGRRGESGYDIDDGTTYYDYTAALNSYSIIPNSSHILHLNILFWYGMELVNNHLKMKKNVRMKLLSSGYLGTHSVYIIQVEELMNPKYPPVISKIYIDKKEYIIRKLTSKMSGSSKATFKINLISDRINIPISDSIFHFVIPKGAYESKIQPLVPDKPSAAPNYKR